MMERPFTTTYADGVLRVEGAIDEYAIMALRNAITEHSAEHTSHLTVDLCAVDYLPSVAVGVLTRAMSRATANGVELALVADNGSMAQRVLMISALPYQQSVAEVVPPEDQPSLGA